MATGTRIAIDATAISARSKGAGRVLKNLLVALPRADPETSWVGLVTEEGRIVAAPDVSEAELVLVRPGSGVAWELRGVARAARAAEADLLFTVREAAPLGGPPTVVHLFEPPAYRLRSHGPGSAKGHAKDRLLQAGLGLALRRAAAVTAGSENTAGWIRDRYGIDARVVLPGIDAAFLGDRAAPDRSEPYFLHPASGDPRENTELVLAAYAAAGLADTRLRLIGTPEWLRPRLAARVAELNLGDAVEIVPWVTDEELRDLYRNALAVVHPSSYEGYAGYPALEAMALGTPVLALEAPGVTEALQGVSVLVPRPDAALLADALRRLTGDAELRRSLGELGRERVGGLTWETTAASFAAVFRDLRR